MIRNDLKFNGRVIYLSDDKSIILPQERQYKNLKLVSNKAIDLTNSHRITRKGLSTKEQYVIQRAQGAYIALVCQPEAIYDLSISIQATKVNEKDVKLLNKHL